MKIVDIKTTDLPLSVKLNDNLNLDDAPDKGMIVQINNFCVEDSSDEGDCYQVFITLLFADITHNLSVASRNWYNSKTKDYDSTYFDFNIEEKQPNGDYKTFIFVMADDDCFDLI